MKYLSVILVTLTVFYTGVMAAEYSCDVPLEYISPAELIISLGLKQQSSQGYELELGDASAWLRINSANNHVLVSSEDSACLAEVKSLLQFMDVPPRQIVIEVQIIEFDNEKMNETGIDWQNLLDEFRIDASSSKSVYNSLDELRSGEADPSIHHDDRTQKRRGYSVDFPSLYLGEFLKIVHESDVGTVRNVPRIVTTNNKTGKLLDGSRITYISNYSSYANIYETEEMTTGLSLEVTPSIGQSGFLKLDVIAKLTSLGPIIGSTPSESGQILENSVIVKNGDPFLLGEFRQTVTRMINRRVPVLGHVLPFLFSRDVKIDVTRTMLVILTPDVIDLEPQAINEISQEDSSPFFQKSQRKPFSNRWKHGDGEMSPEGSTSQ